MQAIHTATPWKLDQYGSVKPSGSRDNVLVTGFSLNTGTFSKEAEANTAFIVRACNAHDDLVKALRDLNAMYARAWDTTSGALFFSPESVDLFERLHEQASAALSKAGA